VPLLDRGDVELYYELRGAGPRLLFFNGSGATIEGSSLLLDILAKDFEVLVHDQRGLGRTGLPSSPPSTLAPYAADAAALLDAVGWTDALVCGMSFGGMVAQEFAVTYPDRVRRLALLCTSAGGAGGSSYPLHTLEDIDPTERARIAVHNLDTRFDDAWLDEHPSDRMLVDYTISRNAAPKNDDVREGERYQLVARATHDVWDRLANVTAPTLVAAGRFDGLAPVANSEAIHQRIPGSVLRFYDGGHLFIAQDPAALRDVVSFLKNN